MRERLHVVERVHELWATGGDPVEEGLIAEDVVYVNPPDAVDSGERHGIDGWRKAMANFGGTFTITGMNVVEMRETGDCVVVLVDMETRARGSGLVATRPLGWIFEIREGRVTRFQWFNGHAAARAAAERAG